MSIDAQPSQGEKVRKDLNLFFASGAPLVIKVLTDLENRHNTFFYRHIGPEGPKETTFRKNGSRNGTEADTHPHHRNRAFIGAAAFAVIAGDRPPRYGVLTFF